MDSPTEATETRGFFRRLWARKIARVMVCLFLYVILWLLGMFGKIHISNTLGVAFDNCMAIDTAVERAVYMKEDEYATVPTMDQWLALGHREMVTVKDFPYMCRPRPDGSLYAILPNGEETPAMRRNCWVVKAYAGLTISRWRQWFAKHLERIHMVFYFIFQPLIWDFKWIYDVYIPAEYLSYDSIYSRVINALRHPCKYSYQGEVDKMNWDDRNLHQFCSNPLSLDLQVHILAPGTVKFGKDVGLMEKFELTVKK
jgi:hypothetical protein